jgi:hypothetical protein
MEDVSPLLIEEGGSGEWKKWDDLVVSGLHRGRWNTCLGPGINTSNADMHADERLIRAKSGVASGDLASISLQQL